MMCGLPLATVAYSCGSEYTICDSVHTIRHIESGECQTGFVKAEPNINDIIKFMKKIESMSQKDKDDIKVKSIKWAKEKYDSKVIASKWMEIFDSLPKIDYTDFSFDSEEKSNPKFQPNLGLSGEEFIRHLYLGYLGAEYPDDIGMKHWIQRVEQGESHQSIASLFQNIAQQNIQKQDSSQKQKIEDLLPKNDKKNVLFVMKESLGDTIISLSLLEGIRNQYPDHNIVVSTDPKYFEVFIGCDFIDKTIPFHPQLEQELFVIGAGNDKNIADVFIMPTVSTQKHLNYLSNNNTEL
jgi:hypothetical protein